MGKDGAGAPDRLKLQLGKGVWRAAHGPIAWRAARAGRKKVLAGRRKKVRGSRGG